MKNRRCYYSMLEILLAMVLGMGLLASAVQLMHQSWVFCRESTKQVHRIQELALVRKRWRQFVHACPRDGWKATGNVFLAGASQARPEKGRVVLSSAGTQRVIQLPDDATAALSIEKGADGPARAVLTLAWHGPRLMGTRPHHVRIVACPPSSRAEPN